MTNKQWNCVGGKLVLLSGLLASFPATAQVVNDGATNTLNNITNTIAADVTVGTNGSFTLLVLSDNVLLTNSVNGLIGRNTTAKSNEVRLLSPSVRWLMGGSLFIGSNGASSRLVVSNGGVVWNNRGNLGFNFASSNNLALVTGAGSVWSNANELYVGFDSPGNQLVVSNGGVARNSSGFLGPNTGGSNLAVVTGSGSVWGNAGDLFVGVSGAGNRLVVSGGGTVSNNFGYVGVSASSSNNLALVTGAGSVWSNALDFYAGYSGANNQLILSNGATVVAQFGFLGFNTNANGNSVIATDPGTRWLLRSDLYVGSNGAFSRLIIRNGASVQNQFAALGNGASSSNNEVVITGAGSLWTNLGSLHVGESGQGNRLVVTNGGQVDCVIAEIGRNSSSANNEAVVTGAGSFWRVPNSLFIGTAGSGNRLTISGGGVMQNDSSYIGFTGHNNEVLVTGPGSSWTNTGNLLVGSSGSGNRLVISNGGVVFESFAVTIGDLASSTNNRLVVDGGTLLARNVFGTAFDVRRGTNVLNAGLIEVDRLVVTNVQGFFEFNGGTLKTGNTTNSNGRVFTVGNGTSSATLQLQGGTHLFANNLILTNNASLAGNGTVIGTLTVRPGGTVAPGSPVGTLSLSNSPVLQGATIMEISKTGLALTNDQLQLTGPLAYGGSLTVTNIGPASLAVADRFKLFNAGTYAGSFAVLSLPPLAPGLDWANKLLVDGSIEVIVKPIPAFVSITRSGTNLIIAGTNGAANADYAVLTTTNLALPLSSWTSIATNPFGPTGDFLFTNGIAPDIRQRFYLIRVP